MSKRRIGVYICHCGGNISDYVDVEKVRKAVEKEEDVIVAKTTMFACSDAAQQEMINDIKDKKLDGLVIASCSPKLHLYTFRGTVIRSGVLNPYQYIQVNIREQDSWAHTDDPDGATEKAIRLVKAGIAKARLSYPLKPIRVETKKKTLVIGGGIAGLRAAISLADMGIDVFLIEKEKELGGWVKDFSIIYPHERNGKDIIKFLIKEIKKKKNITIFTEAELIEKTGVLGDFRVKIKSRNENITLEVGSIVVATGFKEYQPKQGEFGYGVEGVITLSQFKKLVENSKEKIIYNGREVKNIVYIYCVGSRQKPEIEDANTYCSRYCCNAAMHTAIIASKVDPSIHQFHLYRDIRTYGKNEILYENALKSGSVFLKYDEDEPPLVETLNGKLTVKIKDLLTEKQEFEIESDLVVLVTGMVPRDNEKLTEILKLPIGRDGFYNEIHPKLRPVETVIDGVYIAGTCQGPKNSYESVISSLAATSKVAGLVLKGYAELEPQVAIVDPDKCKWCGLCLEACPYSAFEKIHYKNKEVAKVIEALCKGCGGCVPACPEGAIDIKGYEDFQIKAMIDHLLMEGEE